MHVSGENHFFSFLLEKHQQAKVSIDLEKLNKWVSDLLSFLFPVYSDVHLRSYMEIDTYCRQLKQNLYSILIYNQSDQQKHVSQVTEKFFDELPGLRELMCSDVDAIFEGDPAARSREEVLVAYPGFYAIASHRIAHSLYNEDIPLIPRLISKNTHRLTGIDIHPGARIGKGFCIDHGTGIVVGETTEIGQNVKIYQGVTLGALSVNKEDAKNKRHPTIGDRVVIYAGATILGGKTIIGRGSMIGGNVWITQSLPPNSRVYYRAKLTKSNGENIS